MKKWIISDYGNVEKRVYNKIVNPLWCRHIIWCCECGAERPGVLFTEVE